MAQPQFSLQDFDYFVVIDWSSRSKPSPKKKSKDAIWVSEGKAAGRMFTRYFRTRHEGILHIRATLLRLVRQKRRVLVGWDFAFGYPKGFAKALRLKKKQGWKSIWQLLDDLVVDDRDNGNNRFTVGGDLNRRITHGSGPFWGVPAGRSGVFLGARKDFEFPVKNKRVSLAELRLVERRNKTMHSVWKLMYPGSVGSQSLVGIPRLCQLTRDKKLNEHSLVWPFDTDFTESLPVDKRPLILHAEIYPSFQKLPGKDKIVDREQVRAYFQWLQREQAMGDLVKHLAGPTDLSKKERKAVLEHEGWVLGV